MSYDREMLNALCLQIQMRFFHSIVTWDEKWVVYGNPSAKIHGTKFGCR